MPDLTNSSTLNSGNIAIILQLEDGRNICAQLHQNFELDDFIEMIQDKLGDVAVDEWCFYVNHQELLLGDKTSFNIHKSLVTHNSIIIVEQPSVDEGEGCIASNSPNLRQAWTDIMITPNRLFTDFQPAEVTSEIVDVNFFPVERKGTNYLRYCTGWLRSNEKPASIKDCVWKYTSGPDWFCETINLALATDSPDLNNYSEYIKHLKYSIGMSPMNYTGTVYRGVQLSSEEVAVYENKQRLFIPSFTSTSKTRPFANKNTIFHIEISPQWSKFCMEITPEFTRYTSENEVLFSCYNVYQYHRTEWCDGKRIIKLSLLDYDNNFDYRTNLFVPQIDTC